MFMNIIHLYYFDLKMSYLIRLKYIYINLQVIAAEGEQKASRALREAANVIAESSSALQVII